ncbi:MAG: DNA-binding protein [Bacteroidia bacterium]|jgi:excisionase family DNA binding protein|nr:DNA-binding protein [Bacteroidia bacterium]
MADMKIYNVDEVVSILRVTKRTLYNYIKAGQIKAFKVGKEWRVTEEALVAFTERGTDEGYFQKLCHLSKK